MRHVLLFASLLPLAGCSSCNDTKAPAAADAGLAASAPSASTVAAAATAPVVDAAVGTICEARSEPEIVDTGLRAEAGLQLVRQNDRVLLGYAKTNGTPAAAILDGAAWTKATVASTLTALDAKPEAGTQRTVWRVLPLAATDAAVEASVDYTEVLADKTVHVRCGSAKGEPQSDFAGPAVTQGAESGTETVSCRSQRDASGALTFLQSTLTLDGTTLTAKLGDRVQRDTTLKAGEKANGRFAYSRYDVTPLGAGQLLTARYNGTVLVLPPDQHVTDGKADVSSYAWLGAAANGLAVAASDARAIVFVTAQGKGDLWTFDVSAEPDAKIAGKPLKPATHTPSTPATEREILDAAHAGSTWLTVLVETQDGTRQVRLRGFDDSLAEPLPALDVGAPGKGVVDAKLVQLPTGETLLAYLTLDKAGYVAKARRLLCHGNTLVEAAPAASAHDD